ncbi:GNAT family N-acetyltransferase [Glaciihabitans tibetensis]|uniref:GNAT family N-acetyltransferase n=1 Tax=Glaciihabitans tibetensis TaxID=1266600 RepID=UPI0011B243CB|nr:GNAT family N-acetyltransferase [Glaciihabitans tibetensis]
MSEVREPRVESAHVSPFAPVAPDPLSIIEVEWDDPRGLRLRAEMDAEMGELYAERFATMPPESIPPMQDAFAIDPADIVTSIVVLDGDVAVGHAALRAFGDQLEVKRVFVARDYRGRGVSKLLMRELEIIARSGGVRTLILQTADLQIDAIRLYEGLGYVPIPSFRGYEVVPGSLCFGKELF